VDYLDLQVLEAIRDLMEILDHLVQLDPLDYL